MNKSDVKKKKLVKIPKNKINRLKKRHKKYRLRFEIKLFLFVIVISVIFILLSFTVLFKIDNISVTGCNVYASQDIISASGIEKGSNLLICDKNKAAENIYKSFPYIDRVIINKKLPSNIDIIVEMEEENYALLTENGYLIISKKDKILKSIDDKPENMLIIVSSELKSYKERDIIEFEHKESKSILKNILKIIEKMEIKEIKSINLSNLNDIILNYDDRIDVFIGNCMDLDYKLATVKEILENKITKTEKGSLNVKRIKEDNRSYFNPYSI